MSESKPMIGQVWVFTKGNIPSRSVGEEVVIQKANDASVVVDDRVHISHSVLFDCYVLKETKMINPTQIKAV